MAEGLHEWVDDYRLLHRIAVGGMAEIYLAQAERGSHAGRLVVVKRIRREHAGDRVFVEMLYDEARLVQRLDHPNIIRLLDHGEAVGLPYLVLEHVWGESLHAVQLRFHQLAQSMPAGEVLHVGACVAAALHAAHSQRDEAGELSPIIHRDVTLGNVMVAYEGEVKVLDFGIAKAKGRMSTTMAGQIKGTLAYLSPEQVTGQAVSPATDIYQLGVMLYRLLLGRPPVETTHDGYTLRAIATGQLTPPREVKPDLPHELEALLLTALAHDPRQRFQSAAEMEQLLRALAQAHGCDDGPARLRRSVLRLFGARLQTQLAFVRDLLSGEAVEMPAANASHWAATEERSATLEVELSQVLDAAPVSQADLIRLATDPAFAGLLHDTAMLTSVDLNAPGFDALPPRDGTTLPNQSSTITAVERPVSTAPRAAVPAPVPLPYLDVPLPAQAPTARAAEPSPFDDVPGTIPDDDFDHDGRTMPVMATYQAPTPFAAAPAEETTRTRTAAPIADTRRLASIELGLAPLQVPPVEPLSPEQLALADEITMPTGQAAPPSRWRSRLLLALAVSLVLIGVELVAVTLWGGVAWDLTATDAGPAVSDSGAAEDGSVE